MADADDGRDTVRDKAEMYLENITDCVCEINGSLADVEGDEAVILRGEGMYLILMNSFPQL